MDKLYKHNDTHWPGPETYHRPSWHEYFWSIAELVATRATCPRAQCGTVIVDPATHHILATGYNGAPPGEKHCDDVGCIMEDGHCQRAIHSEVNAIAHAARNGVRVDGAHAYVVMKRKPHLAESVFKYDQTCRECAKVLKAANITVVSVSH